MNERLEWLKREFLQRREKNPSFSQRAFATRLGLSPGYVSDLFAEKKPLTPELCERLAVRLGYRHGSLPFLHTGSLAPLLSHIPAVLPDSLVGRQAEFTHALHALCAEEPCRRVALSGYPGVGKTTLALKLALSPQVRRRFTDGVLWLSVGPESDLQRLVTRVALDLKLPIGPGMDPIGAVRRALARGRHLLVLDDVHFREHAETLRLGGAECAHLLTTPYSEIASYFSPGDAVVLQPFSREEALTLVAAEAPAVHGRFAREVEELLGGTAHLPLVLTMVSRHLRRVFGNGSARRCLAAFAQLRASLAASDSEESIRCPIFGSQHTMISLRPLFEPFVRGLNPVLRSALERLGCLPVGPATFPEELAARVAGVSLEGIDELCRAGLLVSASENRLMLPAFVKQALGLAADESEVGCARLIEWAQRFVAENSLRLARVLDEVVVLEEALRKAVPLSKLDEAECLADALRGIYLFQGNRERMDALVATLRQSPDRRISLRGSIYSSLAETNWGDQLAALASLNALIESLSHAECEFEQGPLRLLASNAYVLNQRSTSGGCRLDGTDRHRRIFKSLPASLRSENSQQALLIAGLGELSRNPAKGIRYHQRAFWSSARARKPILALLSAAHLASSLRDLERSAESAAVLRQALASHDLGFLHIAEFSLRRRLAMACLDLGLTDESLTQSSLALENFRKHGSSLELRATLVFLVYLHGEREEDAEQMRWFSRAFRYAELCGDTFVMLDVLHAVWHRAMTRGDVPSARAYWERMEVLAQRVSPFHKHISLRAGVRTLLAEGRAVEARPLAVEALAIAPPFGWVRHICIEALTEVHLALGERACAESVFTLLGPGEDEKINVRKRMARLRLEALFLQQSGRVEEARDKLRCAMFDANAPKFWQRLVETTLAQVEREGSAVGRVG